MILLLVQIDRSCDRHTDRWTDRQIGQVHVQHSVVSHWGRGQVVL